MESQAAAEAIADCLVHYDDTYKVLICKEHRYAIWNLDAHLRDKHAVAARVRKIIVAKHAFLALARPADVRQPPALEPPFSMLRDPVDALLCSEAGCGFISVQPTWIRRHCNKVHDWRATAGERQYWTSVKAQTFFTARASRRYFAVRVADEETSSSSTGPSDDVKDTLAWWKGLQLKHEEAQSRMERETAKTDRTGWFNMTGWPQHLAGSNLKHLAHASRLPDRDEARLQKAAKAVDAMVERCVGGLSTLARHTRRWLRSARRVEPDGKVMARLQNPASQARYARYWKRFICYCLRVADGDDGGGDSSGNNDDGSDDGSDNDEERNGMLKDARRLFRWQGRQKQLAVELLQSLGGDDEDDHVERTLRLSASFVFESVGDEPFSSGLIHFLAVLGIDAEMGRLLAATEFSYIPAVFMYCIRLIAVETLLPAARRDEQGDAERNEFLEARQQFLVDGSYTAAGTILSVLAYGKHIAKNTGKTGNTLWSADGKTLYMHGRPIVVSQFKAMVQDAVAEAEDLLWRELMRTDRFDVPLRKVVDDVSFTKRGESFVNENNGLHNGLEPVLAWALKSELKSPDGTWRMPRVRSYLRRVDAFLELLLLLMHTTGGQPARGTEIMTIRHRNGQLQDRNVFVMDGQVLFVTRYHKSQWEWDRPKVVPRFLPARVGQLLAVYLVHLQPFRELLTVGVLRGHWTDYLWSDSRGPWEHRLARVLKRQTASKLGTELNVRSYRHVAVSIGRRMVGKAFASGYQEEIGEDTDDEAEMDESPLELQNGRTTAVGALHYGVSINIIRNLNERSLETFRNLSRKWHRLLGFDDDDDKEKPKKRPRPDCSSDDEQEQAKRLKPYHGRRPRRARPDQDIKAAMQQVLGQTEVSFRTPEQEQALRAVLHGQTPLVVVLPTGGGKSVLFMVPACMADAGVTVVVVPFRALVGDLLRRLQRARIDHLEWRPNRPNGAPAVVVVSADLVATSGFMTYAIGLAESGHLQRVVVDECHLSLTSNDWRPKLARLGDLRIMRCPVVLLTATLPPVLERQLGRNMLVENATYVRASTVRANIRYAVATCRAGQLVETAVAMCRRRDLRHKGVVYCRSKAQCETIAEELACSYYHAATPDRAERLDAWIEQEGFIVATSALGTGVDIGGIEFVLHVDMPWGMMDYAQESGRAGRSGSGMADSIVLVDERRVRGGGGEGAAAAAAAAAEAADPEASAASTSVEETEAEAIKAYVQARGCRRAVMSRYLDGKEVQCADVTGAAECDRCGEGRAEWVRKQQRDAQEWAVVESTLDELADGCGLCWVLADDDEAGSDEADEAYIMHESTACEENDGLTQETLDEFRRGVRYDERGSYACRKCGIQQRLCGRDDPESGRCRWPNVLVPVVRAAMRDPEYRRLPRKLGYKGRAGEGARALAEYGAWLGERHGERLWGQLVSNGMMVMVRVILDQMYGE
jgi:superfamily II DNA helicase RecQ